MIDIDGSIGEGGGQILRTALCLSLVTGREFRITRIRAGRDKPGLLNQHLASVNAAATIGQAEVAGAELGSQELSFWPGKIVPGEYSFSVGTAGSATLVLQTVLPALAMANDNSSLVLEGGTHNPMAPPFDFVAKAYLPLFNRIGPTVRIKLDRYGFYPAGSGKMRVTIQPATALNRLDLTERGAVLTCRCRSLIAHLPRHVAERELKVLRRKLPIEPDSLDIEAVKSAGPGNVIIVEVESANLTEVFTGFGEKGVRAEVVAERTAKTVRGYLDAQVPVGEQLADQILLPMALAGGGSFVTLPLSQHAITNLEIIKMFSDIEVKIEPAHGHAVRVELGQRRKQVDTQQGVH